ncbi:uncharacterized protein LOC142470242 [Ascaphus truei]|uniref:uncharacterized protein LOC142470242 n=1 Tax=Ascaphus truei TaxID=8439 RepID=UPI003F5ADB84
METPEIEELICQEEPKITPKRILFRVKKAWEEEYSDEVDAGSRASQIEDWGCIGEPRKRPFREKKDWKEVWKEEEDSDEEEAGSRASQVWTCTKVEPFVLQDVETGDEAGDEADSEADNEAGNVAGNEAGYEAGYKAGYEAGYKAGYKAGCEAGYEAGCEAGYEADREADVETDREAESETGSEAESETDREAESEVESEADDKRGDEADSDEGEYERCGGMCCFPFHRLGRRSRVHVAEGPGRRNRGILGALRSWFDRRRGR